MHLQLNVRIVSASLQYATNIHIPMDTMAILEFNGKRMNTQKAIGKGMNPVWNEDFVINVSGVKRLKIKVMDVTGDTEKFIGKAKIKLHKISHVQSIKLSFPLLSKTLRKHMGEVVVEFEWQPHNRGLSTSKTNA